MSSDLFRPRPGQNTVIANIREICALTPVFRRDFSALTLDTGI